MTRTSTTRAAAFLVVCVFAAGCSKGVKRNGPESGTGSDGPAPLNADGESPDFDNFGSPQPHIVPTMHAKLGFAHALLDSVAMRDFFQVEANAMALVDLSKESDWQVHDTVFYRIFSERFREAAEDVAMQARGEDIDAVSRAYVRLTMSCVDCHSYLRKENLTKDMPVRVTRGD